MTSSGVSASSAQPMKRGMNAPVTAPYARASRRSMSAVVGLLATFTKALRPASVTT